MIYFSDGCNEQCKNHKNFTNVLPNYWNYALYAEWYFLAISHGKNACDGTGGTIKQVAAYTTFQQSAWTNIVTKVFSQVFQYLKYLYTVVLGSHYRNNWKQTSWGKVREKQYLTRIKI